MRISILDEARDDEVSYPVLFLAKEKGGLLIATPQITVLIDPFEDLADSVVELVGQPDLPEPRRPSSEHSLEELLTSLAGSH